MPELLQSRSPGIKGNHLRSIAQGVHMHPESDLSFLLADGMAFVFAAMLPGMPKSVLMTFGLMILATGSWRFAIFLAFGYYLLQFLIGDSAYD
jgi:flagellar biosynthesis component FlhA